MASKSTFSIARLLNKFSLKAIERTMPAALGLIERMSYRFDKKCLTKERY
jgi:hypothetical protein